MFKNIKAKSTMIGLIMVALLTLMPLHTALAQPLVDPINNPVVNSLLDNETDGCGVGSCTLREAIVDAEPGSEITFSVSGVIYLLQGQLVINKDLTITGPDTTGIKINGNQASRVLDIQSGAVVLNRLTLQNGYSSTSGAGVSIEGGAEVTMNQCAVMNNIISSNQPGGGIRVAGEGILTLNNCTVSGNQSGGDASGILGEIGSQIAINYSTITQNHNTSGQATSGGGGILGGVSLRGSIVAGNIGDSYWGPDCYTPDERYGTIKSYGYNYIQDPGGRCSVVSVENSGTDQIGTQNNPLPAVGLGALNTNRSFAPYYPLLPGSAALNAIPADKCNVAVDQRGAARPQSDQCDIGAVEIRPAPPIQIESASFTTAENQAHTGSISVISGEDLTFQVGAPPAHGSLKLNGENYTYTPTYWYAGPDLFVVIAQDGEGNQAPATITVTVTPDDADVFANPDGNYTFKTFTFDNSPSSPYQWVDFSDCQQAGGECYALELAEEEINIGLEFPFHFYTDFYQHIRINTEGYLTFTSLPGSFPKINLLNGPKAVLPGVTKINMLNLRDPQTHQISRAVIEFVNLADANDPALVSTFEVVLHDDGTIDVLYQSVNGEMEDYQGLSNRSDVAAGLDSLYFPSSQIQSGKGVTYQPNNYLTPKGQALSVSAAAGLASNDLGLESATIVPQTNAPTEHGGTVTVNSNGSFTYTPKQGYIGPDSFIYTQTNDDETYTGWAFLQVNDPPVINGPLSITVDEDPCSPIDWRAVSDPENDPLYFFIKTYPQHGSLGRGWYCPTLYYHGSDQFIATAVDAAGNRIDFTVNVTVNLVDSSPQAVPDGLYTIKDSNDPQGPQYQWEEISATGNEVTDSDWFDIDDGYFKDGIAVPFKFPYMTQTFEAGWKLWVSTNGFVTLGGDQGSSDYITRDFLDNGIGNAILLLGGDRYYYLNITHIYYQYFDNPERMVIEMVNVDGCCTSGLLQTAELILYPDGRIVTQYKDAMGNDYDLLAVGLLDQNNNWLPYPLASLEDGLAVEYKPAVLPVDSKQPTLFSFDSLMSNDLSYDGDPLSIVSVGNPAETQGTIHLDSEAKTITYTPKAGYLGTDGFTYTITDPQGNQSTALVRVQVDDFPVASTHGPLTLDENKSIEGLLTGSDTEKDSFTFVVKTQPAHGKLTLNAAGKFTYTPNQGYDGPDAFTFAVVDEWGRESAPVSVAITVKDAVFLYFLPSINQAGPVKGR